MDFVVLITDDEGGVAQALAEGLRHLGERPVLVRVDEHVRELAPQQFSADLADPVKVADFTAFVRQRVGPVAGILHLLPLKAWSPFSEMDLGAWRRRLCLDVKSLFYLLKAAGPDLKRAAEARNVWVMAVTGMGGSFASDGELPASFFPGHGGVTGLMKTLALEWPRVRCTAVDVNPEQPAGNVARCLLAELAAGDGRVEVGYAGSRRLSVRSRLVSLDYANPAPLRIDSDWVILITGGGRGITAEVACELAKRYRPTLVTLGRAPLPEPEESPDTANLATPQQLKAALIERMRRTGQSPTPATVEAAIARVLRDREIRRNLAALRRAGARVVYHQVDVRDAAAFGAVIDGIYQAHGRLDGVIHGAGIIEDKLLEDKSPDSFDRVFDTKVDGAFILSRALHPDSLKFLVFFSSVSGRFGNRGQGDYTAANEVLNKLAVYLDRRWPARVVAINWGPWAKTGMVSDGVRRQFAERGVQLIPPAAGCRTFDEELRFGRKGQAEVIIGDGPWKNDAIVPSVPSPAALPLIHGMSSRQGANGSVELIYTLDPGRDRYLLDHQLDGKPVLPAAMAVELMAEVVQGGWAELEVAGVRSLQVLRGIVLGDAPRDIRIAARPQTNPDHESRQLEVDAEITELGDPVHPCYRATVQLAPRLPAPPRYDHGALSSLRPFPMTVENAYREWLFHGRCFQGITEIEGIADQGMVAVLTPSSPSQCLGGAPVGRWLIDPVLLDSSFQLAILWERAQHDMTPLPSRFRGYRRFGPPPGAPVRCFLLAQSSGGGHALITNICFLDAAGRLVGLLEEMEFSCSQALNRLAGCAIPAQEASR